jgi:hypothetical protein
MSPSWRAVRVDWRGFRLLGLSIVGVVGMVLGILRM